MNGRGICLDRKNLPPYIYKINLATVLFFISWFVIVLPVIITVGCIYGDSVATYVTMVAGFALFVIGVAVIVKIERRLYGRLAHETAERLEAELYDMPLEEATAILKENGVITDDGFLTEKNIYDIADVIPFKKALYNVFLETGQIVTKGTKEKVVPRLNDIKPIVEIFALDNGMGDGVIPIVSYELNSALFNFIYKNNIEANDIDTSHLLLNDKENFCRICLGLKRKV